MKWDAEKYDTVKAPQIDAGRELIALSAVRTDDHILDIGCGTGKLTVELKRLAPKGSVTGIDPSEEMLEKARAVAAPEMRLLRTSAQEMKFGSEFTLAFSNSAMHWVKDQQTALARTYRALEQGGRIAFQMPADNFCNEFFDSVGHAISSLGYERFFDRWETPWYFPEKDAYEEALNRAGFRNIRVFYQDYHLAFPDITTVTAWWSSAGLRPYLAALPGGAQPYFTEAFGEGFENSRTAQGVEFDFRRLFAFADKC
jgi:trans-aconitate methyltransferase